MAETSRKTVLGLSPAVYGGVSLAAAVLAWTSWPLLVVIGFMVVYVEILLLLIAVAAGLLGIGAGIYHKDLPAIAMGALGLALIGFGAWFILNAMTHF